MIWDNIKTYFDKLGCKIPEIFKVGNFQWEYMGISCNELEFAKLHVSL